MKLLADRPSVDVEKATHRPVLAVLGGVTILIAMLVVGVALLITSSGTGGDDGGALGDAGGPDDPAESEEHDPADETSFAISDWTDAATDACAAVQVEYGTILDSGDGAFTDVDASVRALTTTVSEIPLPAERDARADAMMVLLAGDQAEQAWTELAGLDREEVPTAAIENADRLTNAYLDRLVALGTGCHTLR